MTQIGWARVSADGLTVEKRRRIDNVPQTAVQPGKPYWLPLEEETTDTSTGPHKVAEAWQVAIEQTRVVRFRLLRDPTADEQRLRPQQFHAMMKFIDDQPAVDAAIAAIVDDQNRAEAWAKYWYSDEYFRLDPTVEQIRTGVGLSNTAFDTRWLAASAIDA